MGVVAWRTATKLGSYHSFQATMEKAFELEA